MFDTGNPAVTDGGGLTLLVELRSAAAAITRAASSPVHGVSPAQLLEALGLCEGLLTQLHLVSARVLEGVPVEPDPTVGDPRFPSAPDPVAVSTHEVALVLKVAADSARNRVWLAETITTELPAVCAAAASGWLKWWQVRDVAEAIIGLDPAAIAQVDARIATAAQAGRCRERFTATLRRAVVAADPVRAEQRRAESIADRRIWFKAVGDGMSAFGGLLPAEDAVTVAACLTRLAAAPSSKPPVSCDPAGRTLDQARIDALAGLAGCLLDQLIDPPRDGVRADAAPRTAVGEDTDSIRRAQRALRRAVRRAARQAEREERRLSDAVARMTAAGLLSELALEADAPSPVSGSPGPRRPRRPTGEIRVTMSAETLLGISQAPAELDGYGPITAGHARMLAQRAGTSWRRLLTDPTSGTVLDIGRTRYRPPEALSTLARARYGGRCTRPGCSHQGRDLDHVLPWESGGDTSSRNLHPVCRGCHTAKHRGWTVTLHDDQSVTWTSPHGTSARTLPTDHRPEDRLVRVGAAPLDDPPPF
jgi:hypothetical protein